METEQPKYNTSEYNRLAQRKYYASHKEEKKLYTIKSDFKREFGADFIDKIYLHCENDIVKIRELLKMKRKINKIGQLSEAEKKLLL